MYSFLISMIVLVLGYVIYGSFVERLFAPDASRVTVATSKADGVDYVPLPSWKIFMIQFLNIAGLGPIFGAIMGAKFGVASYIWIVLGTIFAGAMHDYMAGMISLRNGGESLPESVSRYLGKSTGQVMRGFTVLLLVLVGVVFVAGPAGLLASLTKGISPFLDVNFWIILVFLYYIVATMMPIDKIIGRIYPIFSIALLFMAAGVFVMLFVEGRDALPEFTENLVTEGQGSQIFPMMFISIACGAISGFHASQSPMMARCMTNEKLGRPIFYGAMVSEGIVALIWAAAATCFFHDNGYVKEVLDNGKEVLYTAPDVVNSITRNWLGTAGAVLAMLGVVFAPITSGDTALRSARLIIADFLNYEQKSIKSRLMISIPLFAATVAVLIYSLADADGFNIIWRYFAWANQLLSVFTLWVITVYLVQQRKNYIVSLIPALFMTAVTVNYIFFAKEAFNLPSLIANIISFVVVAGSIVKFICYLRSQRK